VSETDSFIREVSEEVRQDRMFKLWKRYGAYVVGGIALIVAASAGWNWMRYQAEQEARITGDAFLAAEPGQLADAEQLVATTDGKAAAIAEFYHAAALARSGETDRAITTYRAIAERTGIKRAFTDLALLQAARLEIDLVSLDRAEAMLAPMIEPGAPYRLLALELRAVARLNAGERSAAIADLRAIIGDPAATGALQARARQLLSATGGAPDTEAG